MRIHEWFSNHELHRMIQSMRKTMNVIIKYTDSENREQTFLKYWLDTYMCQAFGDEQRPIRDTWITDSLFSGWCRRFIARSIAKHDISFIYSLQKGSKRMWPVLGQEKKYQALLKHSQRIGEFHGLLPSDLSLMIEKTSLEVFKSTNDQNSIATKLIPSGSACLQASRLNGGALSLFEPFNLQESLSGKMAETLGKLRALQISLDSWRKDTYQFAKKSVSGPASFDVDVIPVPEPGKFRIITKGDGYLYTALQPLQGLMLDDWKNCSASTMKFQDLTERVNLIDRDTAGLDYFCSVDYEAATDLLKKEATLACFSILHNAPDHDLGYLSLAGCGLAHYRTEKGFPSDIPDALLIDGQLMGHPLSFPLLCVINLAVYRTSIARWVNNSIDAKERSRREEIGRKMWKAVIVNGDDMLFKCEKSFYEVFLKCSNEAGFKISQGKQYLSKHTCMINSQVFQRRGLTGKLERKGYLNMKLVKGVSLKEGESCAIPTQISESVNSMINFCPWTKCVIPAIFNRWKSSFQGCRSYYPNIYLPVHLGGYGVDLRYSPITWRVTREQRRTALLFTKNPFLALYRSKGLKLPLAALGASLLNYKWTQPMCPLNSNQTEDSDPWLARLALAFRASDRTGIKPQYVMNHLKASWQNSRACSFDFLSSMWSVSLVATEGPMCPPLSGLRVHRS